MAVPAPNVALQASALDVVSVEPLPAYTSDPAAWATAQARALWARDLASLDWDHLADEILDVAKAEERELRRRVSSLMTSLVKSNLRGTLSDPAQARLVREQRKLILLQLTDTPSLEKCLSEPDWLSRCWSDAVVTLGEANTPVDSLPNDSPWDKSELLRDDWPSLL